MRVFFLGNLINGILMLALCLLGWVLIAVIRISRYEPEDEVEWLIAQLQMFERVVQRVLLYGAAAYFIGRFLRG